MPLILMLLVATLTSIYFVSEMSHESEKAAFESETDVRVTNMLIYRNAVTTYAESNPTYTGAVADSALSLPAWFRKMHGVENYVVGGKGYVFTAARAELTGALYEKTRSLTVGQNRSSLLVHPVGGNTGVALPSAIPLNAVVIVP